MREDSADRQTQIPSESDNQEGSATATVTEVLENAMEMVSGVGTVRRAAPRMPVFVKETRYAFLTLLRTRSFSLSVVGFPVMFYVLFGVANRHAYDGPVNVAKAMLGGYACFGTIGAALFGIGVGLASERAMGWLELKRASPMPPTAYLVAKCLTAMAFGVVIVACLMGIGVGFAGVTLTVVEGAKMLGLAAVGAACFASMGLLLALVVPANAAPGIVNLIYLPMSFLSGLWIPIQYLPKLVRQIAPWLPTYHFAQLMESIFGYGDTMSLGAHWAGLLGFTAMMLGASWVVFQRQENTA